ncbi:MAG: C10 family peptidase [Bacteroidales bacterium]|nr:C10 family peptidase [Bacteroidales bacterium]
MMRIFTLLLLFGLGFNSLFASNISVDDAKNVAKNYFFKHAKNAKNLDYSKTEFKLQYTEENEDVYFYVFNIDGQDGFVITSAQDFTRPVLAYSDEFNVDFNNLSPELRFVLDGYNLQIQYGIDHFARPTEKITSSWQNLRLNLSNKSSVVDEVGPLLITTWNQSPYYNDLCPADGTGEHAVVGCVAVAMAQVMKYYNYPSQGEGSKSYYDNSGLTHYANINYANETYEWNNMPKYLAGANEDLAKLMYHCGHTTEMDWEVDGSGTQSSYVVTALENYFKYSTSANEYTRQNWNGSYNYTDAQWELMIRNELDLLRPIVYSGFTSSGGAGHAWNCDGYQSDDEGGYLYHMNYGWGGYGNGYFALDNLIAGVTPGGDDEYFDLGHQIITGIVPEANYPEFCGGTRTISGFEGLIEDGSGYSNYQANIDCQTLVRSECATGRTTIRFERFDLGTGDYLYLYSGPSTSDPLIATFDQNNVPDGEYSSVNGGLLLRFVTDGSDQAGGWDLSYTGYTCGFITATSPTGTLSDGSGTCEYTSEAALNCLWYIQTPGATQYTINFTQFDLDDPAHDYVQLYNNITGATIGTYKMNNLPPATIVADVPEIKIRFKTYIDETNVGEGWTLNYSTNTVSTSEIEYVNNKVQVYPNPLTNESIVKLENFKDEIVNITVTDIVGKVLGNQSLRVENDVQNVSLQSILEHELNNGVYILNISNRNTNQTIKLIRE